MTTTVEQPVDAFGHDLYVGDWVEPVRHSHGQRYVVGFNGAKTLLSCGLVIKTTDIRFLREG